MTLFWDRKGQPIEDTIEWAKKLEDPAYRIVAVDTDGPDEKAPMVSTIWNGIASLSTQAPVDIFETALIVNGNLEDMWRSSTEEQALLTHEAICLIHLGREPRPEDGHIQTIVDREREFKEKQ